MHACARVVYGQDRQVRGITVKRVGKRKRRRSVQHNKSKRCKYTAPCLGATREQASRRRSRDHLDAAETARLLEGLGPSTCTRGAVTSGRLRRLVGRLVGRHIDMQIDGQRLRGKCQSRWQDKNTGDYRRTRAPASKLAGLAGVVVVEVGRGRCAGPHARTLQTQTVARAGGNDEVGRHASRSGQPTVQARRAQWAAVHGCEI